MPCRVGLGDMLVACDTKSAAHMTMRPTPASLQMPVMDGFESAQRMRQHEEEVADNAGTGTGTGAGERRRMTIIGISAMSDTQVRRCSVPRQRGRWERGRSQREDAPNTLSWPPLREIGADPSADSTNHLCPTLQANMAEKARLHGMDAFLAKVRRTEGSADRRNLGPHFVGIRYHLVGLTYRARIAYRARFRFRMRTRATSLTHFPLPPCLSSDPCFGSLSTSCTCYH